MEITGPTLIDLKLRTKSDYESVATAVSGRSVGYFIGSALGGLLVDKLGRYSNLIVALCMNGMAAFTVGLPWAPVTEVIFFISICAGTFEGIINIGTVHVWKTTIRVLCFYQQQKRTALLLSCKANW